MEVSGLCSEQTQWEVGELLAHKNIDVVAGPESWEKTPVNRCQWFGKCVLIQGIREGREG